MSDVFVHETAVVDPGVALGAGVRIWHFCHVMTGAELGPEVVLGQGCFVADGVVIGPRCRIQNQVSLYRGVELAEDVFVGPSAVFTNVLTPRAHVSRKDAYTATYVARGATIGANATIVCGVTLGAFSMIGAGSVVTRDVPAHALVVGNPARPLGWVCQCGERLAGPSLSCERCGRIYRLRDDVLYEVES